MFRVGTKKYGHLDIVFEALFSSSGEKTQICKETTSRGGFFRNSILMVLPEAPENVKEKT